MSKKYKNSDGSPKEAKFPLLDYPLRSMKNSGNNCYRNAILQCLIQAPGFVSFMSNASTSSDGNNDSEEISKNKLIAFVKWYISSSSFDFNYDLLKSKTFGHAQADATEYLAYLFNCLDGDWQKLFGVTRFDTRACKGCGKTRNSSPQNWSIIPLHVAESAQRALSRFLSPEEVDLNCKCGRKNQCNATQKFIFTHSQNCVIFSFNLFTNNGSKIKKIISIESEMKVSVNNQIVDYELFGIVAHVGDDIFSGHYIAYILDKKGKVVQINDSIINCDVTNVEGTPYILFYRKKEVVNLRKRNIESIIMLE